MAQLTEATLWIGRTKKLGRYKIYAVGKKPAGTTSVWILASGDAKLSGIPGYPPQKGGFDTAQEARDFAKRVFPNRDSFARFLSEDLNPLSVTRADAPELEESLELWD